MLRRYLRPGLHQAVKAFLVHQPPQGRHHHRLLRARFPAGRLAVSGRAALGIKNLRVSAPGQQLHLASAQGQRAIAQLWAASRHPSGAPENPARHRPKQAVAAGKENIRAVQADHKRNAPQRRHAGRHGAIGHHPVNVNGL